jgi:hypothetical protein
MEIYTKRLPRLRKPGNSDFIPEALLLESSALSDVGGN